MFMICVSFYKNSYIHFYLKTLPPAVRELNVTQRSDVGISSNLIGLPSLPKTAHTLQMARTIRKVMREGGGWSVEFLLARFFPHII